MSLKKIFELLYTKVKCLSHFKQLISNFVTYCSLRYINCTAALYTVARKEFHTILGYVTGNFNQFRLLVISFFKWAVLAILVTGIYLYFTIFYVRIVRLSSVAVWYVVIVLIYLIFVMFSTILNRYRFGKFTSGVQRIWKRTFLFFWVIELGLFCIYYFYYLTSIKNSVYLDDNLNDFYFLLQLDSFYRSSLALLFCIVVSLVLMFKVNSAKYKQIIILLFCITAILINCLYCEIYQVYYLLNCYLSTNWDFNVNNNIWVSCDFKLKKLSQQVQYFFICPLIRFWHFLIIYSSWCFFLTRTLLRGRINYGLLGFNIQNFLILYCLNVTTFCQFLIFFFYGFLEQPYSVFALTTDSAFIDMFCTIFNFYYDVFVYIIDLFFEYLDDFYAVYSSFYSSYEYCITRLDRFFNLEVSGRDYYICL